MNHHQEVIHLLQSKVATYQGQLSTMFEELLKEARAEQGFLAFENINGKLGIIANKGDYWHLATDQGATGEAVKNNRPSITDPNAAVFKETGTNPSSELIYPIEFSDEVVGAILLDKFKNEKFDKDIHYPMVRRYVTKINEVLADANPWNFRAWWQEQQRAKQHELFERAQRCVEAVLARYASELEGRVESITREGTLVLQGKVMGGSGATRPGDQDIVAAALQTGEKVQSPARVTRHECRIPFPFDGPVQGIVTLVAEKKEYLSPDVIEDLEKGLEDLDYQYFAPALNNTRQGAEHYFYLVLLALTSPPSLEEAHKTLESIAARAEALCADKVQILYVPEKDDLQFPSTRVEVSTLDQILAKLGEPGAIKRPHCLTRDGWLRCPILVRSKVRGLVQVKSDPYGISNIYNADIVVVVALLVTELLARLPSPA